VITYLAATTAGFVAVPIDRDLNEREIRHILRFSEAKIFLAAKEYIGFGVFEDESTGPDIVISMEDETHGADLTFERAENLGQATLTDGGHRYADVTVSSEDLAVLIFTSGTTGAAKAVMLTHGNIAFNVTGTSFHVGINQNDVLLSVLPLHHTYEATAGLLTALYQGAMVCHAENLRRIADNLVETQTSVILGVPALFESMYKRVEAGIREKGGKKFAVAKGVATFSEKVFRRSIRRRIFSQLHEKFGGQLRLMISGAAAIKPEVAKGFRELGIDFIQGYGLTEHSPIISVNRLDYYNDASIGFPIPDAEVRIENEEIVVRGPCVMKGYFMNEEATQETIRDDWLYTGDLGYFDRKGFLHIVGRKKSVIVTPNGKNVYPEEIEVMLLESPFILEALVWGGPEEDPSLTEVQAIIVPDTETLDQQLGVSDYGEDEVMEVISKEVKRINRELARFQRIKKFVLRWDEFEKTTTRKIKRYLYTQKTKPLKKH
jgi:long-chain acyl-CoA synthetase